MNIVWGDKLLWLLPFIIDESMYHSTALIYVSNNIACAIIILNCLDWIPVANRMETGWKYIYRSVLLQRRLPRTGWIKDSHQTLKRKNHTTKLSRGGDSSLLQTKVSLLKSITLNSTVKYVSYILITCGFLWSRRKKPFVLTTLFDIFDKIKLIIWQSYR